MYVNHVCVTCQSHVSHMCVLFFSILVHPQDPHVLTIHYLFPQILVAECPGCFRCQQGPPIVDSKT